MPVTLRKETNAWYIDVRVGKKRIRKKSPVNSKRGAQEYESLVRECLMRGEDPFAVEEEEAPASTFSDFIQEWMRTYVATNNKASEQAKKRTILGKHLLPYFGSHELESITERDVERYKATKKEEGLSHKTINNHLGVLRKALQCAVDWNELIKLPKIRRLKVGETKTATLTDEEVNTLMSYSDHQTPRTMLTLALYAGLRIGEVMGLHWKDVDLERGLLTVRYTLCIYAGLTTPKSNKTRVVPISQLLRWELEKQRKFSDGVRVVSHTDKGLEMNKNRADEIIRRVKKKTGLKKLHWHMLRHTFATRTHRHAEIRAVQELLGHSDVRTTMRYSHVGLDDKRRAVEALDPKPINFGHYLVTEPIHAPIQQTSSLRG